MYFTRSNKCVDLRHRLPNTSHKFFECALTEVRNNKKLMSTVRPIVLQKVGLPIIGKIFWSVKISQACDHCLKFLVAGKPCLMRKSSVSGEIQFYCCVFELEANFPTSLLEGII